MSRESHCAILGTARAFAEFDPVARYPREAILALENCVVL
jgi:hypothetical protein